VIMAKAFPSGKYETWTTCQLLLPHSKEVMSHVPKDKDDVLNLAKIADNKAHYLKLGGESSGGEWFGRRAVEGREKVLGPEHPHTLGSFRNLSSILLGQGRFEEAEAG
jgi:hypothetical protein